MHCFVANLRGNYKFSWNLRRFRAYCKGKHSHLRLACKGGRTIQNIYPTFHVDKLKTIIQTSLDDDKAEDVVTIDLAGKSSLADYMIIASGRSQRHIATLAQHISDRLNALGLSVNCIEGLDTCTWVVVDAGDIIVHLFHPESRHYYNLEKMWGADLSGAATA